MGIEFSSCSGGMLISELFFRMEVKNAGQDPKVEGQHEGAIDGSRPSEKRVLVPELIPCLGECVVGELGKVEQAGRNHRDPGQG